MEQEGNSLHPSPSHSFQRELLRKQNSQYHHACTLEVDASTSENGGVLGQVSNDRWGDPPVHLQQLPTILSVKLASCLRVSLELKMHKLLVAAFPFLEARSPNPDSSITGWQRLRGQKERVLQTLVQIIEEGSSLSLGLRTKRVRSVKVA